MKTHHPVLLACILVITGCTSAGPFVTSISSDGRGGLVVEKSMVKFNSFMGTISNESTTTSHIQVVDDGARDRASETNGASRPAEVWTGKD